MSFGAGVTTLVSTDVEADTLIPCSKDSGRNEIAFSETLDGILRVADASDVLMLDATGAFLIIRRRGGTAGTQQIQIENPGNNSVIRHGSNKGFIEFEGSDNSNSFLKINDNITITCNNGSHDLRVWFRWMNCSRNSLIGWCDNDNPDQTLDTAIKRAAKQVIGLTDGTDACTLSSVPLRPAQLTGNADNYAPTGWPCRNLFVSSDAARDITGLVASVDGCEAFICNVGSFNITLKNDVTSTAANRFLTNTGADIVLVPNDGVGIKYDDTIDRWRVIG